MKERQNFTEGKIFTPLVRFALPVLLALFLQAMYGGVDLLVVGQFAQAADVSGVSTGSQIMHSVTIVITSLAMGLTVLIGGHHEDHGGFAPKLGSGEADQRIRQAGQPGQIVAFGPEDEFAAAGELCVGETDGGLSGDGHAGNPPLAQVRR